MKKLTFVLVFAALILACIYICRKRMEQDSDDYNFIENHSEIKDTTDINE